jgi:PAS domain S-box-containing protein
LGAIPVGFLLLLLAVVGLLRFQTQSAAAWVQRSDRVLQMEHDLTSSLLRASSALNRYVRQRDSSHAAAVRQQLHIEPLASALASSVRDNPAQERRAQRILELTRQFVRGFDGMLAALAANDTQKATRISESLRTRALSESWESQTSAFEDAESALRAQRWEKLREESRLLDWILAVGAIVGVVLTMLSARAFGRRIVYRLERLARSARKMQRGQELPSIIEGDDEIAELDRVYHEMAHTVRERESQLRKYRLLAEHARDIILFVRRSDGRILEANAAAARAYGYTIEELRQLNARDLRAPQTRPRLDAELDRAEATPLIFETMHLRKDGSVFPVEVAAQSVSIDGEWLMVSIVRDISERRLAQHEVHTALKQAVSASRLKSEFLATMSHEIRTPLNAVIGMTELLMQSPLSADQQRCAAVAHDSGEALLHLINDILDFSKIEAKRIELEIIEFKLVPLVEGVASLFASQAARNRVAVMTYVNPWIPQLVLGDPGRLRQVLLNLTGNAVKFSKDGSIVVAADLLRVDGDSTDIEFSVKDTGIGIAPEALAGVFEPFRQADGSMTRRYGGTGLGLSISKGLVELMGGSIGVQSAPGAGSTFSFTLSLKSAQTQPQDPPNLREMRALVIDDDAIAREVFARYLTSWRMRCEVTGDAVEACRRVEDAAANGDPYDVILVDFVMPQMDGFEFARRAQRAIDPTHTRLIMITAFDEPERGRAAIAAGFSAYLTKPVRQSELYDCIVNASSTPEFAAPQLMQPVETHGGRRILVAEDNAINREVALRQLSKLGYAAQAVSDGQQAVQAVLSGQFDVVLMDCQMPNMDGFEATRAIRKTEARSGRRLRIVAMTANALAEDRQACLDAGMDDYLPKPVTLDALQRVLAADGVPALDIRRLDDLFEGDREGIREFLSSVLPALSELIKRLGEAEGAEQLAIAHELKGAAANAGAVEIAGLAAQFESRVRSGDPQARALIEGLNRAHARAASAGSQA